MSYWWDITIDRVSTKWYTYSFFMHSPVSYTTKSSFAHATFLCPPFLCTYSLVSPTLNLTRSPVYYPSSFSSQSNHSWSFSPHRLPIPSSYPPSHPTHPLILVTLHPNPHSTYPNPTQLSPTHPLSHPTHLSFTFLLMPLVLPTQHQIIHSYYTLLILLTSHPIRPYTHLDYLVVFLKLSTETLKLTASKNKFRVLCLQTVPFSAHLTQFLWTTLRRCRMLSVVIQQVCVLLTECG